MDKFDAMIEVAKRTVDNSYWCKFCNRHIDPIVGKGDGMVFVHDDVYHPIGYVFDSGDEHIVH